MEGHIWKAFIPHELLDQPASLLFGKVSIDNHAVYVTASTTSVHSIRWLAEHLRLVGEWEDMQNSFPSIDSPQHDVWIRLSHDKDVNCVLKVNDKVSTCTAVIYNSRLLVKSLLLKERCKLNVSDNLTSIYSALHSTNQTLDSFLKWHDIRTYSGQTELLATFEGKFSNWIFRLAAFMYLPFWWIKVNERNVDSFCRQVLDTVLGLLLMYILMDGCTAQNVADGVLTYGDIIAGELKTLLHWLMGAPAGLKLNSQLTHLLSQFFQYHIYLWTGYLYLLKPVLGYIVYFSSIAGIWGLTVQLSLYQDIFSTLTLHIYCFYVYAARLYCLQLYVLASFWRLFRGKKWNVLRERVDSAIYDADQLFLGTLLFTVLLFLLPTTLIYYFVFTLLRLFVLMIHMVIGKVRHTLNTIPVWSIWLWMSRSHLLTDGALFHIKTNKENQNGLVVYMELTRMDLSEVITMTSGCSPSGAVFGWSTFCKNLLHGDLIFPWIQKTRNQS